jgi:hypothetical protein
MSDEIVTLALRIAFVAVLFLGFTCLALVLRQPPPKGKQGGFFKTVLEIILKLLH